MSYLGLDVGEKRIGVAVSDELNFMAHPIGFIERKSDDATYKQIEKLLAESPIEAIVIGLPRTMKGEIGTKAKEILQFTEELQKHFPQKVIHWDERLTTVEAEKKLLAHDVSRADRKIKRDALAAEIMLQSYLDFLKQTKG